MNKKEFSIIDKSNLSMVNTLIINQCDKEGYLFIDEKHRVINTKTRGLSVSRNLALHNTDADICLLCDDDECFVNDLEKKIINAYHSIPEADLIIFKITDRVDKFGGMKKKLSKLELMRVSSVQISFRVSSVVGKVDFDQLLGAGTPNGSGEENKFLLDCYSKKMKIYYVPVGIATVEQQESTWFCGYNDNYFYKRGSMTRYVYGFPFAVLYAMYFSLTKKKIYGADSTMWEAFSYILKGIIDNNVGKQKK